MSIPYRKNVQRQSSFGIQKKVFSPSENTKGVIKGRQIQNAKTRLPQKQPNNVQSDTCFSKEAEEEFDRILKGSLEKLPNLPSSVVRIFISSTFSDMRAERNTLARDVFPKLKKFCAQNNLDFQVVDMRWGVTEDSQNDHTVEKICLLEVENCQKVSMGPNFVVIIGDRYGFRPIPTELDRDLYDTLHSLATEHKLQDTNLMDTWYKLDDNAIPPVYILQPIRSQFTFYGDHNPGCEEVRRKDTENWHHTFQSLQNILRESVMLAFDRKKVTRDTLHDFSLSVTELEIRHGLLRMKDPKTSCLVFHREINGTQDFEDKLVQRHFDCVNIKCKMERNEEVRRLQSELKEKIKRKMGTTGIIEFKVTWRDGGINPKLHKDHETYLDQFCMELYSGVVNLIQNAILRQQNKIRYSEYYSDYQEVLHHLHFSQVKCETFCGREDVLQNIKGYLSDASMRKPLVLHASSGGGKTSVMAMAMKSLKTWYKGKSYVGVIRFLGTSPLSSNVYDVLHSVCGQLADNADIIMEPVGYKSMKNIIDYMPRFFRQVSSTLKCPVVILLDSLDQLSKTNDAYSMSWLPLSLPANVKLVVSTVPEEHGILDNLRELHPEERYYIHLPILPRQTGCEIIDSYLAKKKRKVTQIQQRLIMKTFDKAPSPLFLKLILDQAVTWNSYTPEHELVLQNSVRGVINMLFDNLETKFGKIVTSHTLGYFTIALNGISENELEDVLSCDDEALNDLYRYHDPPVEGIVRCPPVIVARIQYDIKEYIVERMSHGKYTKNWYHRQFVETAKARYCTGVEGEKLHRNMCEIYMGENGVKRSITLTRRKLTVPDADRQVTPQPVESKNKRMLKCLPYHIIHAGQQLPMAIAKDKCFCNMRFLWSFLQLCDMETLVEFFKEFLERNWDTEVYMLHNFFATSKSDLTKPVTLAINLMASIAPDDENIHLKALLSQAKKFLLSEQRPVLIPVYPCLALSQDMSTASSDLSEGVVTAPSKFGKHRATDTSGLLGENHIVCFDVHPNGKIFVTVSAHRLLKVWSFEGTKLLREMTLDIVPQKVQITYCDITVGLDRDKKQMSVLNLSNMKVLGIELPKFVLDFIINSNCSILYTISQGENAQTVTELDMKTLKMKRSFTLKPSITFVSLDLRLSANERYLVIRSMLTKEEHDKVVASWTQQQSLLAQERHYQFMAVDLQQANGGLMHCRRTNSAVPVLGEDICANMGNSMAVITGQRTVFWDIPTGKCVRRVTKKREYGMMHMPSWVESEGSNRVLSMSADGSVLVTASDGGFVFIWDPVSGLPIGEQAPKTKHSSKVLAVAISPASQWVISVCKKGILKMWDISTATEVFSIGLHGEEVKDIKFSSDSKHVVIWTGSHLTRLLVYSLNITEKSKKPEISSEG